MKRIVCPNCGQPFSDAQLQELKQELAEYGTPPAHEAAPTHAATGAAPAWTKPKGEPKTMLEAMDNELDDPKKAAARAKRKE